jgi:exodeoxyribonuclease VII small subunit
VTTTEPATDPTIEAMAFDEALAQLQRAVADLESGGQTLEASIALYERGVALQARCERLLAEADLKVQQLMAQAGGALMAHDLRPDEATDEA